MSESLPGSNNLSSVSDKTSGSSGGLKIIVGFLFVLAIVLGGVIFWVEKSVKLKKEVKLPEVFVEEGTDCTFDAYSMHVDSNNRQYLHVIAYGKSWAWYRDASKGDWIPYDFTSSGGTVGSINLVDHSLFNASGGPCYVTPTSSPTSSPPSELKIKVGFLGRSEVNWKETVEVCLEETGKCQDVALDKNGLSGDLSFEGATVGQTYTIKVKKPGYLTIASQQTLSGTIDMGKMPSGDLDANNQINSLDWSIMKLNFGKDGQ